MRWGRNLAATTSTNFRICSAATMGDGDYIRRRSRKPTEPVPWAFVKSNWTVLNDQINAVTPGMGTTTSGGLVSQVRSPSGMVLSLLSFMAQSHETFLPV